MVAMTWEECCCIIKQLQVAAHSVHSTLNQASPLESKKTLRALLPRILACLQEFRYAINVLFLQNEYNSSNEHEARTSEEVVELLHRIAEVLTAAAKCTSCEIPTGKCILQERDEMTQNELAVITQINNILARNNQPNVSPADQERVEELVTRLRQQEQQLSFHQGLFKAQQQFSGTSEYSEENFAYGSTPFPTWLNLFTQKAVLEVISRDREQTTLTVLGSSTGSLVLFAVLTFGLRSVGIEILPFLHDIAEKTRQELHIPKDKCCFVCADMLTVSLQDTSILLLTSQCWDASLYELIQLKLEKELQSGALVVDYKDSLQYSLHFQLLQELPGQRVSWNNSQSLFLFKRT